MTSDGVNGFAYDVENRLVTRSGGASATLRYDPLGRLYEAAGPGGTRRFLYDGDALVTEYNSSGTLLRSYVHGTSAGDDPLVWFEGAGVGTSAPRFIYADERGSIVAVTDSNGNVSNVNTYDEYGIPAAGNVGAFQYTGQVWLPELGMYYYKARVYSPTLGRFLQTDPIGYEDQFNLYAYVGNNPIGRIDPSGTSDLNLFDQSDHLYLAGHFFEPNGSDSGVFTITAHGNQFGVGDHRPGKSFIGSPEELVREARANGYNSRQLLFIAACNVAAQDFASRVAQVAGGSVVAANGFVFFPTTKNGQGIDMTKPINLRVNLSQDGKGQAGQFIRYDSRGAAVAAYDRARYSPSTGKVTFRADVRTGSIIGRSFSKCIDKEKCGK